jgi:hypothetical protein
MFQVMHCIQDDMRRRGLAILNEEHTIYFIDNIRSLALDGRSDKGIIFSDVMPVGWGLPANLE